VLFCAAHRQSLHAFTSITKTLGDRGRQSNVDKKSQEPPATGSSRSWIASAAYRRASRMSSSSSVISG
jgi:hypothetical protein